MESKDYSRETVETQALPMRAYNTIQHVGSRKYSSFLAKPSDTEGYGFFDIFSITPISGNVEI